MAESGGKPTGENENPDLDWNIDHDGGDDEEEVVNTTTSFVPSGTSTPYHGGEQHEMNTLPREQSGFDDTVPLIEGLTHEDDRPGMVDRARDFHKN